MDDTYPQNTQALRRPVRAIPQQTEEKKERIKLWMGACLVSVALLIDGFELLTTWLGIGIVMSMVIAPCATLMFWIWYKLLDIPFIASPKKFAVLAVTCFVELIPAFDAIPVASFGWTIGAIILIIMVRAEDQGGILGNLSGSTMGVMGARYAKYRGDFNRMDQLNVRQQQVLKQNMSISKNEIVGEAVRRNPKFNTEEYWKEVESTTQNINGHTNKLNLRNNSK